MVKLKPYQEEGVKFLLSKTVALLADEMGLGKSAQAIRAADPLIKHYQMPCMIICPAIAKINWQREFRKFSLDPTQCLIIESSKQFDLWDGSKHSILSYALAEKFKVWLEDRFEKPEKLFSVFISDEIHFLKNHRAKRTKAIFNKTGLVRYAHRVWGLSGTPMPNHAGELWGILKVFGATNDGYMSFVNKYCDSHGGYMDRNGYAPLIITGTKQSAIPALRTVLKKVMLCRLAKDHLDLRSQSHKFYVGKPNKIPVDLVDEFVGINPTQYKEQEKMVLDCKTAEQLMMLAASVSTLRRFTALMKVSGVAQLVRGELESNAYQKIVIFCHHKAVIEGLHRRFTDYGAVTLYGNDTQSNKQRNIDRFQTDSQCRVVLASILAAGTAINLTAASQVLFLEMDWVPGNNLQAMKRVLRMGNDQVVNIRSACLADSIDERVTQLLKKKLDDIQQLIYGGR